MQKVYNKVNLSQSFLKAPAKLLRIGGPLLLEFSCYKQFVSLFHCKHLSHDHPYNLGFEFWVLLLLLPGWFIPFTLLGSVDLLNKTTTTLRSPVDFAIVLKPGLSKFPTNSVSQGSLSSTEGWLTSPHNPISVSALREILSRFMALSSSKLGVPVCQLVWDCFKEAMEFSIPFI